MIEHPHLLPVFAAIAIAGLSPVTVAQEQRLMSMSDDGAQADSRIEYSGDTVADGHAFSAVTRFVTSRADRPKQDPSELNNGVYWLAANVRVGREQAMTMARELETIGAAMHASADEALLEEACRPEATEWWPDTQAIEALGEIESIRNRVYEEHYRAFLDTLSDRDQTAFRQAVQQMKSGMTMSVANYEVSYADRPEEAQQLLVDFCAGLRQG